MKALEATKVSYEALGESLGVYVPEIDPNSVLSETEVKHLTELINKHHLVLLRSTDPIIPERHIDLTRKLGEPWTYGYTDGQYKEYPEIFKVSNQRGNGFVNAGQAWHSDGSIYNKAMHLSIFAIDTIPADGAATYFTSLSKSLDRLPAEVRERLDHTQADYGKQYKPHPVIWQHPITGKEVLHISEGIKGRFKDTQTGAHYSEPENQKMDQLLHDLLWEANTYYPHQWQKGDLLIADNYAVAHYAKPSNSNTLRVLHRTATKGVRRTAISGTSH